MTNVFEYNYCAVRRPDIINRKGIIFDFDGVLAHTKGREFAYWVNYFETANNELDGIEIDIPTHEQIVACFHLGVRATLRALTPTEYQDRIPELLKLARSDTVDPYLDLIQVDPDVPETFERLHEDGYNLSIVTNNPYNVVQGFFNQYPETEDLVTTVRSEDDGDPPKPDKKPINRARKRMWVRRNNAWMVGDSVSTDGEGAWAAGLKFVQVEGDSEKHDSRADIVIASIAALPEELANYGLAKQVKKN